MYNIEYWLYTYVYIGLVEMKNQRQNEGENEIHEDLSFGWFLQIQCRVSIPFCLYGEGGRGRERGTGVRTSL